MSECITSLISKLLRSHIEWLLENVEENTSRMVPEPRGMSYEEMIEALEPSTLGERRLMGDVINAFRFFTGHEDGRLNQFFEVKLRSQRVKMNIRERRTQKKKEKVLKEQTWRHEEQDNGRGSENSRPEEIQMSGR